MKKKYIAKRNFSIWTLAKTDIAGETIKTLMLNEARTVWDLSAPFECEKCIPELLRLGFIEEKVEDLVVELRDYFKCGGSLYRLIHTEEERYELFNVTHSEMCAWTNPVKNDECKLSDTEHNEDNAAFKLAGEDVLKEESGEWKDKGYEMPLCMHCPKTDHGEIDMNMELATYAMLRKLTMWF